MRPAFAAALLVVVGACYDPSHYQELTALNDALESDTSSSSGSPSSTGHASVTITGGGATTGTTDTTGEGGTESGGEGEGDIGPQVHLQVVPPELHIAGPVSFVVDHSADVERLALFEADDDEPTLEWLAGESPPALLVTRGEFTEIRTFTVRGYDGDGKVGTSDEATLQLLLPPSGTLLWEKTVELGNDGAGKAAAAGTIADEPSILLGFVEAASARVGRYTAEGEPQMIAAPSPAPSASTVSGVALDPAGTIIAAGVETVDDITRPWLARVDPHTAAVDRLFTGKSGEVATGCAVDPESGRIYVSGYSPDPMHAQPDARIWAFTSAGGLVWTKTWERPVEKDEDVGEPIDAAFDVAVLDDGDPVLVGETQFKPDPMNPLQKWAFALRLDPNGSLHPDKTWVSSLALDTAGARSVTADRGNGLLLAGWSSVAEDAPPQATVFAFGPILKEAEIYTAKADGHERIAEAVVRLHSGHIVLATDVYGEDAAEVRGIDGYFGPPAWTQTFQGGGASSEIGDLCLTSNGHVIVVGTHSTPGAHTMFLAGLHP